MANNAFDAMNESAGSDMYVTGGAISMIMRKLRLVTLEMSRFIYYKDWLIFIQD